MFKKIFLICIILNLFTLCFAQIKAPLEIVGKSKGKIKVLLRQEEPFVAARSLGSALGMRSTYFAASGRLELVEGANKAFLTNKQNYAFINKRKSKLSQAPFIQEDILYVPLSFFNTFSSYSVSYQEGKLIAERRYNLSVSKLIDKPDFSQIIFDSKINFPFEVIKSSQDKAQIFLPGAIVKRDEIISSKNDFIYRMRVTQKSKGVELVALLKKATKNWDLYFNGKEFIFEASSKQIKRNFKEQEEKKNASLELVRPSVLQEQEVETPNIEENKEFQKIEPTRESKAEGDAIELGDDFFAEASPQPTEKQEPVVSVEEQKPAATLPVPTILPATQKKGKLKVLIDPGHGGKDPGAVRKNSLREKDLNLKVAKQVYDILKKEKNVEVKMTRNDDTFISLGERARLSTKYESDIFVSIHTNAAKRAAASGFEVYFRSDKASDAEAAQTAALENEALQYEGKTSSGLSFADLLLQSLATNENINQSSKLAGHIRLLASKESGKTGIKVFNNSAIKQANFYVLRGVSCPAVLVEMGYISNASDRKYLNNKNSQAYIAKNIAKGILAYAKEEGWK